MAETVLRWLEDGIPPPAETVTPVKLITARIEPGGMMTDPAAFLRQLFDRAVEVADPMRSLRDGSCRKNPWAGFW
jgi:hypothetical protein